MFEEDLTAFFDTAEFAVAATYLPPGSVLPPLPGVVIFDRNGLILEQQDVQTSAPAALVPAAQWPTLREGGTLTVDLPTGPATFTVRSAMPHGDGALTLLALASM